MRRTLATILALTDALRPLAGGRDEALSDRDLDWRDEYLAG